MADHADSTRQAPQPRDIPGTRSPALAPLHALVGTWFITMTHVALPRPVQGVKTYTWLEGGHFLLERSRFEHPDVPDSLTIIGADVSGEALLEHYFDSRGVSREFNMTLQGGIWKVWRDAPGFSQRFTGTFGEDGQTIEVVGELSKDGMNWNHDFTHTYARGKGDS